MARPTEQELARRLMLLLLRETSWSEQDGFDGLMTVILEGATVRLYWPHERATVLTIRHEQAPDSEDPT